MTKVSVVIIAKNEELRIRDCLESVKWADEIVVVDDESTDKTVAIAEEYGAKVYKRKMDKEGKHRNWGYQQATNEWVLSIDCDERVTPELAKEIQTVLENTPDEITVYGLPIKNYLGKRWIKWSGYYPAHKDRLFRKDKFKYDEEAGVHPRVFYTGKSAKLSGDVIHFSYENFYDLFAKFNRETKIEAEKWIKEGRKATFLKVLRKGISRFLKFYFQKGGWRGGFLGFVFAMHHSLYQYFSYIHYWELTNPVDELQ